MENKRAGNRGIISAHAAEIVNAKAAKILDESALAFLAENDRGKSVWFPKSQATLTDKETANFTVPRWLARKHGFTVLS